MGLCCSGTTMQDSMNYQPDWPIQHWLLYRPIIAHVMNSNPDTQLGTQNRNFGAQTCRDLTHGSILVVGQVQPFGPRWYCPGGRGVGEIKKYVLFDIFAKYMLFLARFIRWLPTSRLHIFKEKSRNLS